MSYSFTQFSTLAKTYTTTAREPSIYVTEFPYETIVLLKLGFPFEKSIPCDLYTSLEKWQFAKTNWVGPNKRQSFVCGQQELNFSIKNKFLLAKYTISWSICSAQRFLLCSNKQLSKPVYAEVISKNCFVQLIRFYM